jgi:hypothetical protein
LLQEIIVDLCKVGRFLELVHTRRCACTADASSSSAASRCNNRSNVPACSRFAEPQRARYR